MIYDNLSNQHQIFALKALRVEFSFMFTTQNTLLVHLIDVITSSEFVVFLFRIKYAESHNSWRSLNTTSSFCIQSIGSAYRNSSEWYPDLWRKANPFFSCPWICPLGWKPPEYIQGSLSSCRSLCTVQFGPFLCHAASTTCLERYYVHWGQCKLER